MIFHIQPSDLPFFRAASRAGEVPAGEREPGQPEQVAGPGGAGDRRPGGPQGGQRPAQDTDQHSQGEALLSDHVVIFLNFPIVSKKYVKIRVANQIFFVCVPYLLG